MRTILTTYLFLAFYLFGTLVFAEDRCILIAVSDNASPAVKQAAASLVKAPLFAVLTQVGGASSAVPEIVSSESLMQDSAFNQAAYNNLVIVGLRTQDPLLDKCWGYQIGVKEKEIDTLGYGHWKGDIGTVECDRNPFLYSHKVKDNPYTTNVIKISGTSVLGVVEAAKAFQTGLLNGIVPAGKIELVEKSLLDREPDFIAPPSAPQKIGDVIQCGWNQIREEEYRAYYDLAACQPTRIWRIKYLAPKCFDDVSAKAWVEGLHRMAYGNTVAIVQFNSEADAQKTFDAVGKLPKAQRETLGTVACVRFDQPIDEAMDKSYGEVRYFVKGNKLFSASLPAQTLNDFIDKLP